MDKYKLVATGEKSRVLTFRVGETVYKALEKKAKERGETVSNFARRLLLSNLDMEEVSKGDILLNNSTGVLVMLMDAESTSLNDINVELMKLAEFESWLPKNILIKE